MLEDPPKMFNINSIPKPLLWDSRGGKSFSLKPPGAVSDNGDGLLLRSATVSPLLQLTGIMIGCSPHSVCEPWQFACPIQDCTGESLHDAMKT